MGLGDTYLYCVLGAGLLYCFLLLLLGTAAFLLLCETVACLIFAARALHAALYTLICEGAQSRSMTQAPGTSREKACTCPHVALSHIR